MSHNELNILLIEDSETDALMVRRTMTKGMKMSCNIFHVKTMEEAEELLKGKKKKSTSSCLIWDCRIQKAVKTVSKGFPV